MTYSSIKKTLFIIIVFVFSLREFSQCLAFDAPIIANHNSATEFDDIPDSYFGTVRNNTKIFYGHTSHGSQLVTGMNMLNSQNNTYQKPVINEIGHDLGADGDLTWVELTRNYLNTHSDTDVVIWSWCGGVNDTDQAGIDIYLSAMSQLEEEYRGTVFVYMTGHLEGTGEDGNLYFRNNQIRQYVQNHNKVLFDFADIESYDPAGNYYPNEDDSCNWCSQWCTINQCSSCDGCSHSHCFNCLQKGKAFWWLLAKLNGWIGSGQNQIFPTSTPVPTLTSTPNKQITPTLSPIPTATNTPIPSPTQSTEACGNNICNQEYGEHRQNTQDWCYEDCCGVSPSYGDLNKDCVINNSDWSIMYFYWSKL